MMMQRENEMSTENLNAADRLMLARDVQAYADRIVGYPVTQIEMGPESPFSQEKIRAAYAVSDVAGRQLWNAYEAARVWFEGIVDRLNGLVDERNATVAWRKLDDSMNEVWERIGRLQACGVDTQPLADIARHFDAWVQAEYANPARRTPAPPPTFAERMRGNVSRMWSMGR
jgi:hypothetical protein